MAFNSTIITKKKQLACGCYDFNFSKNRCRTHATIEDTLKRMNKADESEDDLSDLIHECDALFSKYIRLKYADKQGMVKCFTCDTVKHWTQMQNGHYISRLNMLLRYDERNCRVQDEYCNCYKHGNILVFTQNLEKEYQGISEILYEESKIVYKYSRQELVSLKGELSKKIKGLKHGKD